MSQQLKLFDCVRPLVNKHHNVLVPDGRRIGVLYSGDIILPNGICLKVVLFVPQFHYNLVSIHKLICDLKCDVIFKANTCYIHGPLRKHLLLGKIISGLYYLQLTDIESDRATHNEALASQHRAAIAHIKEAKAWHLRLGHLHFIKLKIIFNSTHKRLSLRSYVQYTHQQGRLELFLITAP